MAFVCFLTGSWSQVVVQTAGVPTLICAPTGIGLAALLLCGIRLWPGVFAGSLFANFLIRHDPVLSASVAAAATLETITAVWLLKRAGFRRELDRLRDVAALFILAGALTGAITATVGTLVERLSLWMPLAATGEAWHQWWLGNFIGDIVIAPALLTWSADFAPPKGERRLEAFALACAVLGTSWLFFAGSPTQASLVVGAYVLFPATIWAAVRFGPKGSATVTLVTAAIAAVGTLSGRGTLVRPSVEDSVLSLQIFAGVLATTSMVLAAAVNERDRARHRIGALNVELEAFNYSIAHDLRGPLRSIDAVGELLRQHPERSQALAGRLHDTVVRLSGLVDGLLRLSGLEYAKLAYRPVDLTAAARRSAETLRASSPGRPAAFTVADGLEAPGDPDLLGVLMWNLLENAWKFSQRRDMTRIEVGVDRSRGEDVFFVRDNGAGFDAAHGDKLFKPFHRLHGRAEFPGHGIGLALARRVVQRHGGRIWASGELERGATFYFTISPRRIDHEEQPYLVGGRRSG